MKRKTKAFLLFISFAVIVVAAAAVNLQNPYKLERQYAFAQGSNYSNNVQLLARCVNGEARGESYVGQVAVAAVILNRVAHSSFPNTIAGVIYQPGAFTAVSDGQIDVPISTNSTVYKACQDAMNGWDPTGGAVFYYNPARTTNKWIYSREVLCRIGNHVFAR